MDVENEVESDIAPENNVGGVFRYYSCEGDEHGFDEHVLRGQIKVKDKPEDVFEKIIGNGACDDCE